MTRRVFSTITCAAALVLTRPAAPLAQDTRDVGLSRNTYQLFELTSADPQHEFAVPVVASRELTLDVMSRLSPVDVEILTPTGAALDSTDIQRFTVEPGGVPPLGAALFDEGFHAQAQVTFPATGTWTVRVTLPNGATSAIGNISAFVVGGMGAGLTMSRLSYQPSDTIVMTLLAFRDGTPVVGASATATIALAGTGSSPPTIVTLADDGQGGDVATGDGIYTGTYRGLQPGHYLVSAVVRAGDDQANGATSFDVSVPLARLAGTKTDTGIDTNGDGLFEWIGVNVDIIVDSAATYEVGAVLRSPATGAELPAAVDAPLTAGPRSVQIRFAARDIREAFGADGPWEVRDVRLLWTSPIAGRRSVLTGRADSLGLTAAYSLTQLQRPLTQVLPGVLSEQGVDTDGNGLFDLLQTSFRVDTLRAGTYTWTGSLRSTDGKQLAVASGQGSLAVGVTTLSFAFDGRAIGPSGINGPYGLYDVAVYGPPNAATLRPDVGRTQAYTASQFEGSQVTIGRLIEIVTTVFIGGRGGLPVVDGIRKSLLQKLTQAQAQAAGGQSVAAIGMLSAFINEVQGLPDERTSADDRLRLVEFATRLQDQLRAL